MSTRSLRACLVCAYIQPSSKFSQQGCPNCEEFLQLSGSPEAVGDCTSAVFEGTITLNSSLNAAVHGESWVAKWLRLEGYAAGLYAVKVSGILPVDYVDAAEAYGVKYIPRDGSAATDEQ